MKQRGMVKWQPFASLPEQSEYIKRLMYNMNKMPRPALSEDQLVELNEKVFRYYENSDLVAISYFHDGYVYLVEGVIIKIDALKKQIIVEAGHKRDKFSIECIVDIELS